MKAATRIQLSTMMFLQFFIWGSWYTTIAVYMTKHNMANLTHWAFTVNPIAAIIAPFFIGLIADRYFASEKVLAILHILGAVFMFLTPLATNDPLLFILLLLHKYMLYADYQPGQHGFFPCDDYQEKQFPTIRVFGTIGWIIAGLMISFVLSYFVSARTKAEETRMPLYLTSADSFIGII